jgi:hypothetical protein
LYRPRNRRAKKGTSIVTPRAAIQQIARMVRDDIRSGELSPGVHSVGNMLVAQLIVDLTGAEGRKKRPDAGMHHAYSFMLGQTLEQLRQRSEAGNGHSTMAMENVRAVIAQQMRIWQARADGSDGACLGVFTGWDRGGGGYTQRDGSRDDPDRSWSAESPDARCCRDVEGLGENL